MESTKASDRNLILVTGNVYRKACNMLLHVHVHVSKNCLERNYFLVLAMVKLVNMSCDKILNEEVLLMIRCETREVFSMFSAEVSFLVGGCPR